MCLWRRGKAEKEKIENSPSSFEYGSTERASAEKLGICSTLPARTMYKRDSGSHLIGGK